MISIYKKVIRLEGGKLRRLDDGIVVDRVFIGTFHSRSAVARAKRAWKGDGRIQEFRETESVIPTGPMPVLAYRD